MTWKRHLAFVTFVSNQYADLGVTFNNPRGPQLCSRIFLAIPPLSIPEPMLPNSASLRSFAHAVDHDVLLSRSAASRCGWVCEAGVDEAMQVTITAFDAEEGGQEVATASMTLGPSSSLDIPVQTPLEVTDDAGAIRRVEVGFSPPSEAASNLVFDDVEFEPDPGQVDCPAVHPPRRLPWICQPMAAKCRSMTSRCRAVW